MLNARNYNVISVRFEIDLLEDNISDGEFQLMLSHLDDLLKLVIQQENLCEEKVS